VVAELGNDRDLAKPCVLCERRRADSMRYTWISGAPAH
jgi:hypothetical protein